MLRQWELLGEGTQHQLLLFREFLAVKEPLGRDTNGQLEWPVNQLAAAENADQKRLRRWPHAHGRCGCSPSYVQRLQSDY